MKAERFPILIVDDNPADLLLYRMSLSRDAFDIAEAESGQSGIEACRMQLPDCIVLDFNLPGMDGLEFLSLLRAEFGDLPCAVVMLTGVRDERIAVSAMKSGATDYIPKTENIGNVLEHAITGAIEKFRMRRQIDEQTAALAASERQYRTLMEAIPQLVWVADAQGTIQYSNQHWSEYPGTRMLSEAVAPEDRERYHEWWRGVASGKASSDIELRLLRASDHSSRCHLLRAVAMHEAGQDARWLGTAADIDDRKQAERAVQQKQKWESVGLLAGGIAHDFNNLLVGILGGASYVVDTLPAAHPAQSILDGIVRSGELAARLTRQLLAYSGRGQFFVERVELSTVVRETCALIRSSIPPNVHLTLQRSEELPAVETDVAQMQQVIMNLVINAAESISENQPGFIVVRTFARQFSSGSLPPGSVTPNELQPGGYVVLEVQDNGCGMDEETKARVFDPFFSTKFTGRGLGLAAVQGILRSTQGGISVESAKGEGSTFRVYIPALDASTARRDVEPPAEVQPEHQVSQTILVIDDEDLVRKVVRLALERAGYKVLTAEDAATGLEMLKQHHANISLVLLDMGMPGMGGSEVLSRIRASGMVVPVAVCSGYSESEVLREFAGCEFTAFVQKPFKARDLPERIGNILRTLASREQ